MKLSAQAASLWFLAAWLLSAANGGEVALDSSRLRQRAIVDLVNSDESSTWEATLYPRFEAFSRKDYERLGGTLEPDPEAWRQVPLVEEAEPITKLKAIPDTFDSRSVWPQCPAIKEVLDQGSCGACWAFATVEILQDRFCIFSSGGLQARLAPNDPVACCGNVCYPSGNPCDGGYTFEAINYFTRSGAVTQACSPYFLSSQCKQSCSPGVNYPSCTQSCANGASWWQTKWYSSWAYRVTSSAAAIQQEVLVNGPITVQFSVYEDFYNYKSGVYQYSYGKYVSGHAVKLVGWGTENGVPYWLIANSWGPNWGLGGFYKMRRGSNECGIESFPVACLPKIQSQLPHMDS